MRRRAWRVSSAEPEPPLPGGLEPAVSTTLLEPPPSRPRPSAPRPSPGVRAKPRPRVREERVIFVALALSVLVHLLLFVTLRFETEPGGLPASPAASVPELTGMRVIEIIPVPDALAPEAEAPEPLRERVTPRVVRTPASGAPVAPPTSTPRRDPAPTVAERITPRMGDARLFEEPGRAMPAPTDPEALARERFLARIGEYNDSAAAASEAARRATDWTVKDGDGNRWGISPGKIHLGGLTLPLPVGFAPPPGRREELAERNRRFGDIQDQRARETGRATFDERVKAMRERADAKRDSTRRSGSGS